VPGPSSPKPLTNEQIDLLADRLKAGEYLDEYLRPLVFRQPKEYELDYAAKTPKSRVLADTMAVPLQRLKQFGKADNKWANKLVFGDNLQVLKTLMEMKGRRELLNSDGTEGIRLAYLDPPFATLREFRGSRNQRAYRDKIEGAAFVEFLRKRLVFISELLADDGTLYLHLDTKKVHYMKVVLDELLGEGNFRNEIVWKRADAHSDARGQGGTDFGRIHDVILRYTKTDRPLFHPQHLPLPESTADKWYRHVEEDTGRHYNKADITGPGGAAKGNPRYEIFGVTRHWRYSKERMEQLIADGLVCQDRPGTVPYLKRYLDESRGVALQDIWTDIPMLRGYTRGERTDYPTQKPEALLTRIVEASSNPGDLVLDCFAGSGTSAVVSQRLGRRWVAVDCGKLAVYIAQRRLLALGDNGTSEDDVSFEFCSAGLYDNDLVEAMSMDGFCNFCLDLFGCREEAHVIGGIQMAGTRKGGPVHFFPFKETDAEMGREYLDSLAGRLKGKVTGEVYVVAPVTSCDPGLFEDVINVDKLTFFILRVPYSVIEALHGRRFKLLDQPFSAEMVNDPMDTFGFDFVQLPEVKVTYRTTKTKLTGTVKTFMRGGLDPDDYADLDDAGRLDLAMVLVDRDYDGEVFRVSDHFFGDELEQASWKFSLPLKECGKRLLVIFMDTHGNEFRETIEPTKPKPPTRKAKAASK
jgi:site-specific DNA-methyltransferase (adenine-specific)/adenine-specific DNA-methyltransferase